MQSTPPGPKRKTLGVAVAALAACAPLPAFAADVASSAWTTYLFFAIVATVVIVLLLHEALDEEGSYERADDRASDAPGMRRYVRAQQSSDVARRPNA